MPSGVYYDEELETKPWGEVQALSFEKAKIQIERVYATAAHYRRKLDAAGVRPGDVRGPGDLARVPFFEKDERASQAADPWVRTCASPGTRWCGSTPRRGQRGCPRSSP